MMMLYMYFLLIGDGGTAVAVQPMRLRNVTRL